MKRELQIALTYANNEKALAISNYADSLDEAIDLFKDNCQMLVGVDWNKYVDVLYIILHIPQFNQYLPQLDLQVPNYKTMSQEMKMKFVITFELYCQIYYIKKKSLGILLELIHRHLGLPRKAKFLSNADLMVDIMIYGKWAKYDELKIVVKEQTANIQVPLLYLNDVRSISPPKNTANRAAIDQIKAIFPDFLEPDIILYLDHFDQSVETLVDASFEGTLPRIETLRKHKLKENETAEVFQAENPVDLADLKKLTLSQYDQQIQEENDRYEAMYDTSTIPGEDTEDNKANTAKSDENSFERQLMIYYLKYGELIFIKENRKHPVRVELLDKLKWSHEQVEGWLSMTKRRPELLNVLKEKYNIRNDNRAVQTKDEDDGSDNSTNNSKPTTNRGRGRGRGRGSGKRKFKPI